MRSNPLKLKSELRVFYSPVLLGVQAGFPSPAGDYQEAPIDLNRHLVQHAAATFFVRVEGESMIGAHIPAGALLVVDRALKAKNGSIVLAVINGEFTVKRLEKTMGRIRLLPENPKFKPIEVTEDMQCEIWGVVRAIVIDKPE